MKEIFRLSALKLAGRLAELAPRSIGHGDRLLLIRPDHLGDLLLTTPALQALRRARPEAHVTILIGPWSAPILANNPDVDQVLTYRFPWFDRGIRPSLAERYAAAGALATRLRALRFDEAIVLRPDHWWGAMAAALAGICRRRGGYVVECRPFLTEVMALPPEHATRSSLRLVGQPDLAAAAKPGKPPTYFEPTGGDRVVARRLLRTVGLRPGARFALLHPGASTSLKLWPAERWAAVVDWLASRRWRILLVGGPGDDVTLAAMADAAREPPLRLPTNLTLGTLGALLGEARVALGLDSAAMHLATAVATPSLRLYGPGDEALFGPWGDPALHPVARAPGTHPDPGWFDSGGAAPHPSMLALPVDQVLDKLERLLRRM